MTLARGVVVALVLLVGTSIAARQQTPGNSSDPQPRFRGGANLVRVDTYVTADGAPVSDLNLADFEVLEDSVPQRVETFQLVQPRGPASAAVGREPNTVAESREMARDVDARVFVLFMDIWHVQLEGSFRAQAPLTKLLDRSIGQDDLVGVMHPDMAARNVTFARRMTTIAGMLKDNWYWGERGQFTTSDPREQQIIGCYPDADDTIGIAAEMIRRRRETKTLTALEDLVQHLEDVRPERKFVFLMSEGWLRRAQDPNLARSLRNPDGTRKPPPGPPPVGVDPEGRLRTDPRDQGGNFAACERERSLLAYTDNAAQFDHLIQRANRSNVSFYPIDFRGLVTFDEPISSTRALTTTGPGASPAADSRRLGDRHDALRELAENTDGMAIIDTNNVDRYLERIVQDTGVYYLLGYYSSNTKLDGRYRRLTVRVKRQGAEVRARPGYLAPTEAELASSRVDALMNGAPPGHTNIEPSIVSAFAGLVPTRGNVPLRLQSAASPARIWLSGEVDQTTFRNTDWQQGGRLRATFEHEKGASPRFVVEQSLPAGQRTFLVNAPPEVALAAGRYVVRLEVFPAEGKVPLQTTVDVYIPETDWLIASSGLTARRGPSTGLQYVPTADSRFRRTERIRLEVPRSMAEGQASARLLTREGKPLNIAIALSERTDADSGQRMLVADVVLAPLAQGDYAVEISIEQGDRRESATYAFRLIP
jgi:VWFA-related protein